MHLRSVRIKNYRSLEDVQFEGLEQFNVVIGRNNVGKSSFFGAISWLSSVIWGRGFSPGSVLSDNDKSRALEIELCFVLSSKIRREIISDICSSDSWKAYRENFLNSPFFRQVRFLFRAPPGHPQMLHLRQTSVLIDDSWGLMQEMISDEKNGNTISKFLPLQELANRINPQEFRAERFNFNFAPTPKPTFNIDFGGKLPADSLMFRPLILLSQYLEKAYFFNPFRHSTASLAIQGVQDLRNDGSNLAQVLHTLHNNHRRKFSAIEKFIHGALPDIGILETPLMPNSQNTEISFTREAKEHAVRLHDMGGGVEQLLMAATVLVTTDSNHPIFLEEPESHLHAGAQRYLIEKLCEDGRQVFVATHSPTFLNAPPPKSLHQLVMREGRSYARKIDSDSSAEVLADIGARNSDVLFSDAVVFTEGTGDAAVLIEFSRILGFNLAEKNISLLSMEGGDFADRRVRIRREILQGIARKTNVPHMFVFDRDERPENEINDVTTHLGQIVYFLQRREIENYLLIPEALLKAVRLRLGQAKSPMGKITSTKPEDILALIHAEADKLYETVLLKRIRSQILSVKSGGIFPRQIVSMLAKDARNPKLGKIVEANIAKRSADFLRNLTITKIVTNERKVLDKLWRKPSNRLMLAPGSEIVEAVFSQFGVKYSKPNDTRAIAAQMMADEIPKEIQGVIERIIALQQNAQRI